MRTDLTLAGRLARTDIHLIVRTDLLHVSIRPEHSVHCLKVCSFQVCQRLKGYWMASNKFACHLQLDVKPMLEYLCRPLLGTVTRAETRLLRSATVDGSGRTSWHRLCYTRPHEQGTLAFFADFTTYSRMLLFGGKAVFTWCPRSSTSCLQLHWKLVCSLYWGWLPQLSPKRLKINFTEITGIWGLRENLNVCNSPETSPVPTLLAIIRFYKCWLTVKHVLHSNFATLLIGNLKDCVVLCCVRYSKMYLFLSHTLT